MDGDLPFPPDGRERAPSGGDINEVDRVDERSGHGCAAVGNGVGFQKSGAGLVPLLGLDRDVLAQERAGFGGGQSDFPMMMTPRRQDTIDGCRRNLKKQRDGVGGERGGYVRQPQRDHCLQTLGADHVRGNGELLQDAANLARVIPRRPSRTDAGARWCHRSIQQANGILAVVPAHRAELIKDEGLLLSSSRHVARSNGPEILALGLVRHAVTS